METPFYYNSIKEAFEQQKRREFLPPQIQRLFYICLLPDECRIHVSGDTELRSKYPDIGGCAAAEACALHIAAGDLNLVAILQADVVDLVLVFG